MLARDEIEVKTLHTAPVGGVVLHECGDSSRNVLSLLHTEHEVDHPIRPCQHLWHSTKRDIRHLHMALTVLLRGMLLHTLVEAIQGLPDLHGTGVHDHTYVVTGHTEIPLHRVRVLRVRLLEGRKRVVRVCEVPVPTVHHIHHSGTRRIYHIHTSN